MFSNIGFSELVLILVIALVVFGPRRLPEIGKALGDAIRSFKGAMEAVETHIMDAGGDATEATGKKISRDEEDNS